MSKEAGGNFIGVFPLRFHFAARDAIHFPDGQASNVLRGAFGTIFRRLACDPTCPGAKQCDHRATCAYARVFEPGSPGDAARGYGDWPRPFVFRAAHLEGRTIRAATEFSFDMNLFDTRVPSAMLFALAFAELSRDGLGPGRGRAELLRVTQEDACLFDAQGPRPAVPPLSISLEPADQQVERVTVQFVTPTELKVAGGLADRPEFSVLIARLHDRIAKLNELYGESRISPLAAHASEIKMTRCEVSHVGRWRRSTKTGAVHPLGGFVGEAQYEGDLGPFLPFLRAAKFTGVGRQTAWGKGELHVET